MTPASVLVRPATVDDVDSIVEVHVRGRTAYYDGYLPADELVADNERLREWRDGYASRIGSPGFTVLCAELCAEPPRVVGFALIGPCHYLDPHPATISELRLMFVDPEHVRLGIGALLHTAVVQAWQAAGVESARLWVWEFNKRARAFYASQGWQSDGHYRPDDPRIGEHRMMGYRLDVPPLYPAY
jgi:GNAT superfamily N-acetyltransferase